MALYEHVIIARPDISPQQVDALIEDVTRTLAEQGGRVAKNEYWGLRNLAYRVRKNRKGHYSLLNIDAPAAAVHELERRLRINEDVLRYLTIRVEAHDEEPSPILARRDRDEKRRARRDGERDGEEGGDGDSRPPRRDREDGYSEN
jgi:small subunit ribosomal protein S6